MVVSLLLPFLMPVLDEYMGPHLGIGQWYVKAFFLLITLVILMHFLSLLVVAYYHSYHVLHIHRVSLKYGTMACEKHISLVPKIAISCKDQYA